jgi:hypothetical protein
LVNRAKQALPHATLNTQYHHDVWMRIELKLGGPVKLRRSLSAGLKSRTCSTPLAADVATNPKMSR